ncbi:putative MFS family arabinose efflux permease [Paraburkholderia sp. CI2]|uniref:MFS transporter n=1 Tax=Paraburkholderia sp. CI2 TaxID=2723093 RepID=UPI00161CB748|nr:MFS transporter [Paraburkholderia sp. CI2]MBB5467551.1 putative MFS family arabinose efflux permease [Paraburkholderia sp. CI2]
MNQRSLNLPETWVVRDATFVRIWAAIFASTVATFLLLMTLSAAVFTQTHSPVFSNGIVLTQWVPAVLALPLIRSLASRYDGRSLLIAAEVGSALSLLVAMRLLNDLYPLLGILVVKGTFDNLSKVARPVAVKRLFTGATLDRAASYYNTAMLFGGGVGALAGALFLPRLSSQQVIALSIALHLISACSYATVAKARQPADQSGKSRAVNERADPDAQSALVYFIAAVALFQGYHNIARSVFAVDQLGMPASGIALLQAVTNIAYVVGALAAARIGVAGGRYRTIGPLSHCIALATLIPLIFITRPAFGVPMYAVFAFGFEAAYCVHMRFVLTSVPSASMPRIMANANAWALGLMLAVSLGGSYLVSEIGFAPVTLMVIVVAALVPLFARFRRAAFGNQAGFLEKEVG